MYLHNCSTWFGSEFSKETFCAEMLKNCRNLDTFEVISDIRRPFYGKIYKYRHIATSLRLGLADDELPRRFGGGGEVPY